MKILAFSDLHRDAITARAVVTASVRADVVIGAGDYATRGQGMLEMLSILQLCEAPVVLVHGNHDEPAELSRFCADWPGSHYLHGSSTTIGGHTVFGLGGEIPSRSAARWNVTETEVAAEAMLACCPPGAVIISLTLHRSALRTSKMTGVMKDAPHS